MVDIQMHFLTFWVQYRTTEVLNTEGTASLWVWGEPSAVLSPVTGHTEQRATSDQQEERKELLQVISNGFLCRDFEAPLTKPLIISSWAWNCAATPKHTMYKLYMKIPKAFSRKPAHLFIAAAVTPTCAWCELLGCFDIVNVLYLRSCLTLA